MADDGLLVTISGAALSLLLYENVRSVGNQMGFLLGEIVEYIVQTFTDTDNQVETVKIHINIETIMTCSMLDILHDSSDRIDKEKLKHFLADKSKQVIGWFRFRNSSCLVPTLKEKLLHKQFASHFSSSHGHKEEYFITCLLSSSVSDLRGIHKFKHVLLRRRRGAFEPISLQINNLKDGRPALHGSDYKHTPRNKSIKETDAFTKIIQPLKKNLLHMSGEESAFLIETEAEKYLNTLIPKVCQSDREVSQLEQQVRDLRAKLYSQNLASKTKVNGSSDTTEQHYDIDRNSAYEDSDLSPEKVDTPSKIYEDDQLPKYHSLTDASSVHRPSSTRTVSTESVPQEKLKMGLDMDIPNSKNREPLVASTVSDTKLDLIDGSPLKKNKGSINTISEIARQPITMAEQGESGMGRGNSKHKRSANNRKARRG